MAKSCKPIDLQSKHLTKEEYENRKEQEEKLKGNNDKVYKVPKSLSKNKEGKKLYKFIVKELKESNILNNLDITILETCVDAILKKDECKKLISELGLLIPKADGSLGRNPATTIYKDYNSIFNKCCMELGLSPSSRSKLANINVQAKNKEDDPVLKALAGDD